MTKHGHTEHAECEIMNTFSPEEMGPYPWDQFIFTLFSCGSVRVSNDEYEAHYTREEWTRIVNAMEEH